jgi:hypothetical protein
VITPTLENPDTFYDDALAEGLYFTFYYQGYLKNFTNAYHIPACY